MTIVIGAYALTDFVRLNLHMCRKIWPRANILVSDDRSEQSPEIERVTEEYEAAYVCSARRRTHTSGDWQAFINGAVQGWEDGSNVLKLSQRFIPTCPEFRTRLEQDFQEAVAVLPGKVQANQIARPQARLYLAFGHLTDCVMFNPEIITPQLLADTYNQGYNTTKKHDLFPEIAWGRLGKQFTFKYSDWLANYEPLAPKLYLRKACSNAAEYQALAEANGIKGQWDIREWKKIEVENYRCIPA